MNKQELENHKVPELKEIAKNLGIAGYDSVNKAKLIDAILGPEKAEKKEGVKIPFHSVPGKYLKFNEIEKGEN